MAKITTIWTFYGAKVDLIRETVRKSKSGMSQAMLRAKLGLSSVGTECAALVNSGEFRQTEANGRPFYTWAVKSAKASKPVKAEKPVKAAALNVKATKKTAAKKKTSKAA